MLLPSTWWAAVAAPQRKSSRNGALILDVSFSKMDRWNRVHSGSVAVFSPAAPAIDGALFASDFSMPRLIISQLRITIFCSWAVATATRSDPDLGLGRIDAISRSPPSRDSNQTVPRRWRREDLPDSLSVKCQPAQRHASVVVTLPGRG